MSVPSAQLIPGERRAGESAPAFEAFALYRDLGPSRSINLVGRELSKSASLIGRWSAKWRWIERVDEWDRHQDERRRAAESAAVDEMSHRHADAVQVQIEALVAPATALLRRLEEDPASLSALDTKDLALLVSKSARPLSQLLEAERKALGAAPASDAPCCEHEAARRLTASMTREELIAMMLGDSAVD